MMADSRACYYKLTILRYLAPALLLVPLAAAAVAAPEEQTLAQLAAQVAQLERQVPALDKKTRSALEEFGEDSRAEFRGRRKDLDQDLREWNEDPVLNPSTSFDIEKRRRQLKEDVELWIRTITAWDLDELQAGVSDALVIAREDGLDVYKLGKLHELTKKIIREADFAPPNTTEWDKLDALNLSTSDRPSHVLFNSFMTFWGLGNVLEIIEADARAKHQEYRRTLYKRSIVAYVRALISGDEKVMPCRRSVIMDEVRISSGIIKLLGCPDPVVNNLKAYAQAVQKIQSADTDMFEAEAIVLIAEQQFISDVMSTAPFVGEALDVYGILWGQDIAGQCITTDEQIIAGVFLSLPIIGRAGPWAIKQIEKRSPLAAELVAEFRLVLGVLNEETAPALTSFYREIGVDLNARMAKRFEQSPEILKQASDYFRLYLPRLEPQAQANMITFRNVRDALESRVWRDALPEAALKEARARSAKVMKEGLGNYQMTRSARIKASNLAAGHPAAIEQVARARDEVIIIRYVNPGSTELIELGAGTKHMGIKGKSANRGPIRALLPVNQNLNKQGSRLEDLLLDQKQGRGLAQNELDEIVALKKGMKKGKASMEQCLGNPRCAIAIEYPVPHPDGSGEVILQVVKDKKTDRHVYFVTDKSGRKLDPETGKLLDVEPIGDPENVLVLADPETGAPLTADYDFLALGVQGSHGTPTFDPDTGFVTPQMNASIEAVNEATGAVQRAKGIDPQKVSHHGAERWYPFSPGALDVDPFVTAFHPKAGTVRIPRCDSDCMKTWCRNTGQCNPKYICPPKVFNNCIPPDADRLLKDFFHDSRLTNYDLSPNPVWSWGNYNAGGGWNFSSYAESFRIKQKKLKLAREEGKILSAPIALKGRSSVGDVRTPIAQPKKTWAESLRKQILDLPDAAQASSKSNTIETMTKKALPGCTERAS